MPLNNIFNNIKKFNPIIICVVLIIILYITYILYNNYFNSNQVDTIDNYDNTSNPDQTHEIILYYAMWCGYSKMFLPEWEKFVEHSKKNFPHLKVTSLRCEGGDEASCQQKGVEGYPTVILYSKEGKETLFQGERTLDGLIKFIDQNIYKY